jgi:hypothetical protein
MNLVRTEPSVPRHDGHLGASSAPDLVDDHAAAAGVHGRRREARVPDAPPADDPAGGRVDGDQRPVLQQRGHHPGADHRLGGDPGADLALDP